MTPNELNDACDRLAELQYRRRFFTNLINQQHNAGKAMVRRFIGFDPSQDEDKREKVNARATRIFSAVLAGKDVAEGDQDIAAAIGADLAIFAKGAAPFVAHRHEIELEMKRIARKLPIAEWQQPVKGFGELALAAVVGEVGNFSKYDTPSKVWKRLGLAPYAGRAGSTWRSMGGLSSQEWTDLGYSGKRRSVVYADVGSSLFKHQWRGEKTSPTGVAGPIGHYGELYAEYKAKQIAKNEAGGLAEEAAEIVKKFKKGGSKPLKDNVEGRLTPGHIHNRAMRYMTKKLLADLWSEWRRVAPRWDAHRPIALRPTVPDSRLGGLCGGPW